MKVIFLTSSAPHDDGAIADRLALAATELEIVQLDGPAAALEQIRGGGEWLALMISPTVPQADALELIEVLRREAAPIAIVPLVTSVQQGFIASALAAGADDVLMVQRETIVNLPRTLARIRQSPHLRPTGDRRRLRTLYAGDDALVWRLIGQISFVGAERATVSDGGVTPIRTSDGEPRCDVVVIDEPPDHASALKVLNSIRAQSPDLPVVMLANPAGGDSETEALDLGANAIIVKTGMFRRRLVAALRNVHQRLELAQQTDALRSREARLRQIVETAPVSVVIISGDGTVLAINAEGQRLVNAPRRSAVVGQQFTTLVAEEHRTEVTRTLRDIADGTSSTTTFDAIGTDGSRRSVDLHGVLLERDARGSRGVIAVLQRHVESQTGIQSGASRAELDAAIAARRDAEALHEDLIKMVASERAGWNAERVSLTERIEALEAIVGAHAGVEQQLETERAAVKAAQQQLDTSRTELAAIQQQLDAERNARQQAEQALQDARRAADDALAATKAEHATALRTADEQRAQSGDRLNSALDAVEAQRASLAADLSRLEAGHRWLLDCGLIASSVMTPDGELLRCNDTFAKMFGYLDADDAVVRTDGVPFPGTAGRSDLDARLQSIGEIRSVESDLARIDGRPLRVVESAQHVTDTPDGRPAVRRVFVEVAATSLSESADTPQQTRWLEAVGRMAAEITPDIESAVTSIQAPAVRIVNHAEMPQDVREQATLIVARAKRASLLLRQLQKFSHKQSLPPASVDVRDVVQRAEPLLSQLVGSHIDFEVALESTATVLAGDEDLQQLVSALVVSVRDLLPMGGVLSVETTTAQGSAIEGENAGAMIALAAMASGYGVQSPQATASLESLAQRCGGSLEVIRGDARVGLAVRIPCVARAVAQSQTTAA